MVGNSGTGYLMKKTSSPTMYTKGLILLCIIDTIEGQQIATTKIPGAFLQTDYDKGDIHINMEEVMVTPPEDIDPDYYKYFI